MTDGDFRFTLGAGDDMSTRIPPLRAAIVVMALALASIGASLPARAQSIGSVYPDRINPFGQITALHGPATSPTGFTIELGTYSFDETIAPKATITAKSAEAEVEGLAVGDYAIVHNRRVKGQWLALHIVYDVQPIAPLHALTGTALRLSPSGKLLFIKPDTGRGTIVLHILARTRFLQDGKPLPLSQQPPLVTRGQQVDVVGRRVNGAWLAYDVDLKSVLPLRVGDAL